jgi:hypothetical protein|tara:strand:- start:1202 stop:1987 length:786 start_codon:yes stop_codon:yes gene_type:complete
MRKNKAYLEKCGGEWSYDFIYSSVEPLKSLGFEIVEFDADDMENTLTCYQLDIEKDVIFGSVKTTAVFFEACGIETPTYLGYPEELKSFLGRRIIETTFEDVHRHKYPVFIKPSEGVKKFTGCLIERGQQLGFLRDFDNVTDFDKVFLSEPMEFISEYRCFVHEGELKGIQFYLGDFKVFPDIDVIESAIKRYTTANCAYTLDVGVTKDFSTWLVEVNDMWAIGSYGMDGETYALMCVRRMREIGRQAKGETESLWKKLKR